MSKVNVLETIKLLEHEPEDVPWERYHGQLQERFASQDIEWLREFTTMLLGRGGADDFSTRVHEVLKALALIPGNHAFEFLMSLGNEESVWAPPRSRAHANGRARVLGAALASAQPLDACTSPIPADLPEPTQDLLACWLQEAVLRGKPVANHPNLLAIWECLKASGHELATATPELDLVLGGLEQGQPKLASNYSLQGACSWGGYVRPRAEPAPGTMSPRLFSDVTGAGMVDRLAAFSASARTVSNGEAEVRVWRAEKPVATAEVDAAFIRSLPLLCVSTDFRSSGRRPLVSPPTPAKARAGTSVAVEPLTNQALFELLMMSASYGGDYNVAWSGAYGRLAARRTFSALVGAAELDPWERVEQLAQQCSAWVFAADSPWFFHISADVGVLVLQPDKQTLTVVASTDID